ncbi:cytochrome b [Blastopirellula marina]|uniref:Cytochrome B n=1 Tax=Blastopirellula marina TaxID=124 RepID=A0A2S8FND7_9BACT|nr:cytochrome b [Blastopirellula marina]PQO33679.1 cytochrome B [Blastopirellula marina]PTL43466.1 cytochrome b [Blastopirellula marina]
MNENNARFPLFSQILHWVMAVMILSMLFIGVAMVSSLANYHWLISIHRPLGIAILGLALIRLANRIFNHPPALPDSISPAERFVAAASEMLMYGLMLVLPLVGWAMLSAARYPIVLFGSVQLPFILPQNLKWYALLHTTHTILAYLFMLTVLAHFTAVLFHTFVLRDGLLFRMLGGPRKSATAREQEVDSADM